MTTLFDTLLTQSRSAVDAGAAAFEDTGRRVTDAFVRIVADNVAWAAQVAQQVVDAPRAAGAAHDRGGDRRAMTLPVVAVAATRC